MKTIAYTMVQNDMKMLELWARYYSKYFDNLYVVCWNTKPKYKPYLDKLSKKYRMEYDDMGSEEEIIRYGNILGTRIYLQKKQVEFLANPNEYDWVLYTNVDEILAPNKRYKNLKDLMKRSSRNWIACGGYEVIQVDGEGPIDYSRPYFKQRKYWIKNPNYNKILLSKVPLDWVNGMHKLAQMTDNESTGSKNTGLYLIHLKHADLNPKRKRDFGPYRTNLDPNIMEHWLDRKRKIPEYIRRLI